MVLPHFALLGIGNAVHVQCELFLEETSLALPRNFA